MTWQWFSPTRIIFGSEAVMQGSDFLKAAGNRTLIVTGKGGSARRNGSLEDICRVLDQQSIHWELFAEVEANPGIDTIRKGAQAARSSQADFIIGIGGGSPLDAAKAIAILAVNDISNQDLFDLRFRRVLPIVALPTTAGTGSEVTPYSIITYPEVENKKSIASPLIAPVLALNDPKYTEGLPLEVTLDTAVDAFTHVFEGYLSLKHSILSDRVAGEALCILGKELRNLAEGILPDSDSRSRLLYASTLAGMVISQTYTSIPHALGYCLTYFKDVSHGRANGLITPVFARFNLQNSDDPRTMEAIQIAGFATLEEFSSVFAALTGNPPECSEEELDHFADIASQVKNAANNVVIPDRKDIREMFRQSLKK